MPNNPCLTCGVCCAHFLVSFYWRETDDFTPNGVPAELTEQVDNYRKAMKGSNQPNPRCIALRGELKKQIYCDIYERRSSVCREFPASYEHGERNERCDRVRAQFGLPPVTPDDWK
jgi:Fe-S-cluster containining protein